MSAGPPAEEGTMIFTGFVGYAVCANAPVARQTAATDSAIWRSNLLKAMFLPPDWIPRLLRIRCDYFLPAADPIIAIKAAARPSPAHGPMDAPVAVARCRSKMRGNAGRARS